MAFAKTIAESTRECQQAFRECFEASAVGLQDHEIFTTQLHDQSGLLNLWAENTYVFQRSRASRDYRVLEAPFVRTLAIGLVGSVCTNLRQGMMFCQVGMPKDLD